ncbi:XRE family transcriptional regulator [Actinomadura sp. KC216]|uniref:helix-turn-helix domain-containing protein n=1 Tax=Actinomadura sp. KC216 TaxID=2530370 RepID=UPI001049CA04|nr:helix-turn-helix transcriptional regulator [Actinomadura sp. KC216]TDB80845.1 XRE family transcriptional regulator [Actinomadura sp. KC216]
MRHGIRGHPAEVRRNMSSENTVIGVRLRAARKAAGLTVADVAERWRDLAPEPVRRRLPTLHDLERTIRGHEAGEHKPGPRYRILWARALQISEDELFSETDERLADDPHGRVRRPEVLEMGIAAGAATITPGSGHYGPVAPELVGYFRQQLPGHYSADIWLGPHMLIATVDAQTRLLKQLVRAADSPVRRGLLEMGVAYAALLGWLYQDAADLERSAHWRTEALDMAHRHGDPQLVSYALANKAMHAVDLHDGAAIVDYAQAALADERHLSPKVRVLALVHIAHGYGFLGDRTAIDRTLDDAQALVEQVDGEYPWGNACRRTPRYMDIQRATAYGRAGAHDDAARLWDEILGDQPDDHRRDTGVFRARQAAALAATDQPERAVAIAAGAATVCTETGSERLRAELAALPAHASAWAHSPRGRDLTEIIASVT